MRDHLDSVVHSARLVTQSKGSENPTGIIFTLECHGLSVCSISIASMVASPRLPRNLVVVSKEL